MSNCEPNSVTVSPEESPVQRLAPDRANLSEAQITARAGELAVQLVATSSIPDEDAQRRNVTYLESFGAAVRYQPAEVVYRHGIPARESLSIKAQSLRSAWLAPESNTVFALRGGYGAADLLAAIDWPAIPATKPLVGFSDVSALHSAFYAAHGAPSIHGPMIGHGKCGHGGDTRDIAAVIGLLTGTIGRYSLGAQPLAGAKAQLAGGRTLTGPVFGGCLSVITGLIGTPYFPGSLKDHILFFEDVGESLHRLVRLLSQWQLAGALDGVQGIVLGRFADCGDDPEARFGAIIEERTGLPCLINGQFGHIQPNFPVIIGMDAELSLDGLSYTLTQPLLESR